MNSFLQCSLSLAWIRYELAELVTWVQIPEGALFLYVFVLFYELLRFLKVVEESVGVF